MTDQHETAMPDQDQLKYWTEHPEEAPPAEELYELAKQVGQARVQARALANDLGARVRLLVPMLYRRGYTYHTGLAKDLQITHVTLSDALEDDGIPPVRVRGQRAAAITNQSA